MDADLASGLVNAAEECNSSATTSLSTGAPGEPAYVMLKLKPFHVVGNGTTKMQSGAGRVFSPDTILHTHRQKNIEDAVNEMPPLAAYR